MEFPFSIRRVLGPGPVVALTAKTLQGKQQDARNAIGQIIDALGAASAKAQGLPSVITTMTRFLSSDHVLYIVHEEEKAVGLIKAGVKKLFIRVSLPPASRH